MYAPNPVKAASVEFVNADGTRCRGAEALFRALGPMWVYRCAPRLFESTYRFIADRRGSFGRLDGWL